MKSYGTAPGKVILLGEHLAFWGVPALLTTINRTLTVELTPAGNSPTTVTGDHELSEEQQQLSLEAINVISHHLGILPKNWSVNVTGNLPMHANLGSSAAFCVAVTRALADQARIELTRNQLIAAATQGESVLHGTSSGMDIACVATEGLISYRKTHDGPVITPLNYDRPIPLVIAQSSTPARTAEMVAQVHAMMHNNPALKNSILAEYQKLISPWLSARFPDLPSLGVAMNRNHELLKQLNLSTEEIEDLINAARDAGALGVKLTGGGGGGSMVALCRDREHQQAVAQKLRPLALSCIVITV